MALPVLAGRKQPVQFRAWKPGEPLAAGRFAIPYPRDGHKVQPAVVFVSLVGFDYENHRLGYGGAYCERALAGTTRRPLIIGVGLELMRLPNIEPLPNETPMDVVVTEAGVFRRDPTLG